MTSHVGVDTKGCIYAPMHPVQAICLEGQWQISSRMEVLHHPDEFLPIILIRILHSGVQKATQ
eukprot:8275655-Ditylum_brightwellii.AAC.1